MQRYRFIDNDGSFRLEGAENDRGLYFPIAGEGGLKCAITPNLCGDAKIDQNHFILEPTSIMDLAEKRQSRNFWCRINGKKIWSATGMSALQEAQRLTEDQEKSAVEAGYMWHKTIRESQYAGLGAQITNFVDLRKNVEIMHVVLRNITDEDISVTPVAAIPIYGRSADNIRDHRHVTSLLHRIKTTAYGVHVTPTLSFDERGHQINDWTYYVEGMAGNGDAPECFYPEYEQFVGAGGTLTWPEAVLLDKSGVESGYCCNGQEAMGAIRFTEDTLAPGESREYMILIGATRDEKEISRIRDTYCNPIAVKEQFNMCCNYWKSKNRIHYHTGDEQFDQFMNWVNFQPELRRIYGCSFLPHHDYGKGGRGWRDLWQDCLALLIMDPKSVRDMLVSNFSGVRIDGTNATIIGDKMGEFKADRNGITRVWMDHGVWPLMTTKLYLEQTGDMSILYRKVPYFKDRQVMRGTAIDENWNKGIWQEDENGKRYEGTVIEHLILQALCAFYEVGEHNHIRLRDADWNDAIDMAGYRGESVAFTNAYAKNLQDLGELLIAESKRGVESISLLKEIMLLLQDDSEMYDDVRQKCKILQDFTECCKHTVSGTQTDFSTKSLGKNLINKALWMKKHIAVTEWIEVGGYGWFNGYYDDNGCRVEGKQKDGSVRMMLTGQVFSIMAGTASEEQIGYITKAVDKYLYDEDCGGYRLNTDFNEIKTDMGRMFGFAYGEKENGGVFSHMAVMYANALYERGHAKEGFKALKALYKQSMNFEKSRIYPGIPEYFGKDGRGLYHYLTGAASWYMLTVVTCMFGIRGRMGDLVIAPQLLKAQFDDRHRAGVRIVFQGIHWDIDIENPKLLDAGEYQVTSARLDADIMLPTDDGICCCNRQIIESLDTASEHKICITLKERS